GTPLSTSQLNAVASVPGSYQYTSALGTVLSAGTQTLTVLFTPDDSIHYTTASRSVQLSVNKATPTVTWNAPAPIPYGVALSALQLNATADAAGTNFVYAPPVGTVLLAGTQTLSVTFTPEDAANYTTATQTVQLIVNKATPTITWTTPAPITYGTALSAA